MEPNPMTPERRAAIKARAEAATFGPWGWFGTPKEPYLATQHGGRVYVMRFARSGMRGATVMWQGVEHLGMVKTKEVAVKEREYRDDLESINHPDAIFIAASRQDVSDLLAEVERLTIIENRAKMMRGSENDLAGRFGRDFKASAECAKFILDGDLGESSDLVTVNADGK